MDELYNPTKIAEAINDLVTNQVNKSKTSKIKAIFPIICDAKEQGITNIQLLNLLNNYGFDLTLKTFENILHRIRKKKGVQRRMNLRSKIKNDVSRITELKETEIIRQLSTPADIRKIRNQEIDISVYE